jgi:hypothetical protein
MAIAFRVSSCDEATRVLLEFFWLLIMILFAWACPLLAC